MFRFGTGVDRMKKDSKRDLYFSACRLYKFLIMRDSKPASEAGLILGEPFARSRSPLHLYIFRLVALPLESCSFRKILRSWQGERTRKGFVMAKNIYVGNLVWDATAEDLIALFQQHGQVKHTQVITDRETGRSRGFGFVEMENDGEAQTAIEALNGTPFQGRPLTVNEAKPREVRGGSGPYSGGGGGRGGYGGGGRGSY
jgi:RNA recognition motif. (a.k.a. RRM, RBD, or RNP domain)